MSQVHLLEEMNGWNQEMCQRELPAALPKLFSMFQCSNDGKEKIRLFRIVTEMFMPHISILALERDLFLQLLPKAVKHFHNLVFEISSQAPQLSSENTEMKNTLRNILQDMTQWIEVLTICVRNVCSIEEQVTFENIQSLPSSVLQVLIATFTHCKDSDSIYCGRLHLVSDLLQALFKEAVSLEKQLMELLDKTTLSASESANEISGMVSVIHSFVDICSVVSKMDHTLHANTWKCIIKQTLKYHTLVKGQLHHDDIIRSLCDDILLSFQSCLHLAEHMKLTGTQEITDQRLFQKTVKLCRFFANSLVHYIKSIRLSEGNRRLERLKNEKCVLEIFFCKTTKKSKEQSISLEPSTKRPRQATFTDEEVETHINGVEKSLLSIQSLLRENPIPQWLPEKLCSIQSLLKKIQNIAEKI